MFSQIPTPPSGAIESWLISAAAVGSLILLGMKLFVRKPPIEAEFVTKADREAALRKRVLEVIKRDPPWCHHNWRK